MTTMNHVRWLSKPVLKNPTIVAAFTGWNDAADAASNAVRNLVEGWGAVPLAEIDPEEFTDYATIRPHIRLKDGVTRNIVWPTVGLWHVSGAGGDIILMLGPEPSLKWRLFSEQILGVADHFSSSMMLTLGSLLADVPHTRPVQIIGTANDTELVERFNLQRSRYEGPTGIVGVLHDACSHAALPSAALWAAVPAYASQVPSPKASLSLMRRSCEIIGTPAPIATIMNLIERYEEQVNSLVSDDEDLAAYVERLETMSDNGMNLDDEIDDHQLQFDFATDKGDDESDAAILMDEVEQFLRDQGEGK
ncbi:MAG: PAC2 family protein [Ilumatobacteraceae bacterium]